MSYTRIYLHVTWRTYRGIKTIPNDKRRILLTYMLKVCESNGWTLVRGNSHLDHVHLLLNIKGTDSAANVVKQLKGLTSHAFQGNENFPLFQGWNKGYGAFSVGYREVEIVKQYIKNQDEHHRTISTEDEFNNLLKEHGLSKSDFEEW